MTWEQKSSHQNTFKILESLFPSMGKSALQHALDMFDLGGVTWQTYEIERSALHIFYLSKYGEKKNLS